MPLHRFALLVEGLPQLGHQAGEVRLVLGAEHISVPDHSGVLPVHVEAVQVVAEDERDRALHEGLAARGGEGGVGEALGPRPAADRDEELQVRVFLPQTAEHPEVLCILGEAFDHLAFGEVRERIVDVGDLRGVDGRGIDEAVLGKHVGDDHVAGGLGRWSRRGGDPGRLVEGRERGEQADHDEPENQSALFHNRHPS